MYGSGLRLLECLTWRVKDIDVAGGEIRACGRGRVALPTALDRKALSCAIDLAWPWVFPASRENRDAATGEICRHHLHETAVHRAVREAGIAKRATCHTLRHSIATHLLADGYDVRTLQEFLWHSDVRTTMMYRYVLSRGRSGGAEPGGSPGRGLVDIAAVLAGLVKGDVRFGAG